MIFDMFAKKKEQKLMVTEKLTDGPPKTHVQLIKRRGGIAKFLHRESTKVVKKKEINQLSTYVVRFLLKCSFAYHLRDSTKCRVLRLHVREWI